MARFIDADELLARLVARRGELKAEHEDPPISTDDLIREGAIEGVEECERIVRELAARGGE